MLQLKRVEVQGFKSFCDRTEMRFNGQGVAAIVGPNGCGKSNLSDAISWVLGEQSAKSLRGARMEDVIFAGTRDRKPVGMAQVTITLVDPQYVAELPAGEHQTGHPAKSRETVITRRLYRSGDSEYLINGRVSRLRDIQDLFLGTGLGPESYAIIEQGRIGQILSTKPADRRGVIEEAAGITKFKTRRRLAEAKLEGAKQNLNRVFDILEEVGRQANSLKRQAQKAERFKTLRGEYVEHLKLALAGRFRLLERDAAATALDLGAANSELQSLNSRVTECDQQQTLLREKCFATEAEVTEARSRLAELNLEAERTRGRLENQARHIGDLDTRLTEFANEAALVEQRCGERQTELEAAVQQAAGYTQSVRDGQAALDAKGREREAVHGELRTQESAIEGSRRELLRLMGEASGLRNQLTQTESRIVAADRDNGRLRQDEQSATDDLARLEKARTEVSERIAARQLELESLGDQRKSIEAELVARRQEASEARRALDQTRADVSRIKARKDSLEEILSHRAYTTESVKNLFTAIDQGKTAGFKPIGVVADFVEVDGEYEKAAEEFLHEELEYVVVDHWDNARRGIELMRTDLGGRASFLVHPEQDGPRPEPETGAPAVSPEAGITSKLTDILKFTNGLSGAPAQLLPRLSRCYLAADADSAQKYAEQYPGFYFLLADGVCYQGRAVSGGKKSSSGPLALKRELREVTALERKRQGELEQAAARLADLEETITRLAEGLESLRGLQQTQEKEALALEHESRKFAEESQRANSRLSVSRMELDRLNKEQERLTAEKAHRTSQLEAIEQKRQTLEASLAQVGEELAGRQQRLAHLTEEHAALRAALASLQERLRHAEGFEQRLQAQVAELRNRRQVLAADQERTLVQRDNLAKDNIQLTQRREQLALEIQTAEARVMTLAGQEQSEKLALAAADETLRGLRASAQELAEKRNQIELELVRKQSDLKHVDENCRSQLDTPVAAVAESIEVVLDEDALVEAEEKARDLNRRIEALGPVNTQALEEFEEAQRRYDFLNTQRQDLIDSIRDTERAIQEIDVESKKRFAEAFEKINEYFREMFKTLFSGGLGEMRLTDQENANDSGIDIVAQPPGKKLQNVLLLSGGERAMTAMALLMAIFRYQPSPFCILDEVDAPLDEPNIQRLTRLLKEMAEQTQFIVITHAKRTMESAEAIYGVTMQEPGVSKLVSVRFRDAVVAAA